MDNNKQTAVDFLIKEVSDIMGKMPTTPIQTLLLVDAIIKAKELEKTEKIEFAKLHVSNALQSAANKMKNGFYDSSNEEKSIMNSYPLELITL